MSEILNSYADSVIEKKGNKKIDDVNADIKELDARVSALEEGGGGGGSSTVIISPDVTTVGGGYIYFSVSDSATI